MASKKEDKDHYCRCSSVVIDLPLDGSRDMDWNAIGNKIVTHLVQEVNCISCVDRKDTRKTMSQSQQSKTNWEYCYEKDNIRVFKNTGRQTRFAGRGVIEVPLKDVASFIKTLDSSFIWKKFIIDVRCERMIKDSEMCTDYIAYEMYQSTQYCGLLTFKREMLYFLRCSFIDGMYIQSAVSVELPERPQKPDVPRVDVYPGTGFVLESFQGDASKTLVTFFGNVDLKGLPSFMMYQVLKRYPLLLRDIRQYFSSPRVSPSPTHTALDASISSTWIQELTLGTSSSVTENFEDAVPCQHYIHHNITKTKDEY